MHATTIKNKLIVFVYVTGKHVYDPMICMDQYCKFGKAPELIK